MHPYITQAIAAERVADMRRDAAARRRARSAAAAVAAGAVMTASVREPSSTEPRVAAIPASRSASGRTARPSRTRLIETAMRGGRTELRGSTQLSERPSEPEPAELSSAGCR
jgi:hypothetical protein